MRFGADGTIVERTSLCHADHADHANHAMKNRAIGATRIKRYKLSLLEKLTWG